MWWRHPEKGRLRAELRHRIQHEHVAVERDRRPDRRPLALRDARRADVCELLGDGRQEDPNVCGCAARGASPAGSNPDLTAAGCNDCGVSNLERLHGTSR
jgi:hypothetical protein